MENPPKKNDPGFVHREELLDEALDETFPASDPVAPLPDEADSDERSEQKRRQ